MAAVEKPAVFISWSHGDPGFTARDRTAREAEMVAFANALRNSDIDVDIDLYHPNEDWTRFGPRSVDEADVVIAVLSEGWSDGWMGRLHATPGVTAECDVLKSLFTNSRELFDRRLRLVRLNGSHCPVPGGLDRVQRFDIPAIESDEFRGLVDHLNGARSTCHRNCPATRHQATGRGGAWSNDITRVRTGRSP